MARNAASIIRSPSSKTISPLALLTGPLTAPPRTMIPKGGGMSAAGCGKRFSKGAAAISPSGVIPTVMRMRIAAIPIERNVRRQRSPDHDAPTSAKTSSTTIGERNIQKTFEATKNTDCLLIASQDATIANDGETVLPATAGHAHAETNSIRTTGLGAEVDERWS